MIVAIRSVVLKRLPDDPDGVLISLLLLVDLNLLFPHDSARR